MRFGSHQNAYTSFEETVYWLHVPSDFAERAIELLAALVCDVRLSDADVDAERKIVLEEWRGGKDWAQRASETHFRTTHIHANQRLSCEQRVADLPERPFLTKKKKPAALRGVASRVAFPSARSTSSRPRQRRRCAPSTSGSTCRAPCAASSSATSPPRGAPKKRL